MHTFIYYVLHCMNKRSKGMSKVLKETKIHNKGCNAMYVKGVKRDSKYTIRAHHIFGYNFLNIKSIFNLKKVLRSCDLGLCNHTIKCYVCMLKLQAEFTDMLVF